MIRKESGENGRAYLRKEYVRRINRVIDYIEANLDKDLSLDKSSSRMRCPDAQAPPFPPLAS